MLPNNSAATSKLDSQRKNALHLVEAIISFIKEIPQYDGGLFSPSQRSDFSKKIEERAGELEEIRKLEEKWVPEAILPFVGHNTLRSWSECCTPTITLFYRCHDLCAVCRSNAERALEIVGACLKQGKKVEFFIDPQEAIKIRAQAAAAAAMQKAKEERHSSVFVDEFRRRQAAQIAAIFQPLNKEKKKTESSPSEISALNQDGLFSSSELAKKVGLTGRRDLDALEKRLCRWRKNHPAGGWIENSERTRQNQAKYLYPLKLVFPLAQELKASHETSPERLTERKTQS